MRQQEVGQREMTEMVGADLQFEPVGGTPLGHHHDSRVVDQDVKISGPSSCEFADRGKVREVQLAHLCLTQ